MMERKLGVLSLATLLVSAHYGLGFLLGTAEKAMTLGAGGSLYAVSLALGTVVVFPLISFYWIEQDQIWSLLGDRYGKPVQVGVGLMSWTSLIGAGSVQMIAAATILTLVGIPSLTSLLTLTLLFCLLSLLPVERASWVFRGLLLVNILVLVYALATLHGLPDYWRSPVGFATALHQVGWGETLGVCLSTSLLVVIDMKCHQFIVQAQDRRTAYWGCGTAALLLLALAFLPSAVVTAAQQASILPPEINGKAVIPYLLVWIGGGATQPWGIVLIAILVVPALGLGSNVLRIQRKTILDLQLLPASQSNRILLTGVNALVALAIALHGGEVISLLLSFYTAYLSSVWLPFVAYLLAHKQIYSFAPISVQLCLGSSSLAALTTLALTLWQPQLVLKSPELTILLAGLGTGVVSLVTAQGIEILLPGRRRELAKALDGESQTEAPPLSQPGFSDS